MKQFRDEVWLVIRPKLVDVGEKTRRIHLGTTLNVNEIAVKFKVAIALLQEITRRVNFIAFIFFAAVNTFVREIPLPY